MAMVMPVKPGEWPEPVTVVVGQGELPNPGDHSLEDVNAFNKRSNVPVTEEKGIDDEELKKPPHILITAEDRIERKGNPDWKPRQFKEVARTDDRRESIIVPTEHQYLNDPIDDEG